MTYPQDAIFDIPPLSAEDQRLIDAYLQIGKSVDSLPYSDDFEKLMRMLNKPDSKEERHFAYQRLLHLRKRGRLPRIGPFGSEAV